MELIDRYIKAINENDTETIKALSEDPSTQLGLADVVNKLAELDSVIDGQQELSATLASIFTTALTETIVSSGLVSDVPAFKQMYVNNLDKEWTNIDGRTKD